jgi:hypothetical protein
LERFGCGHPPAAVLEGVLPARASAHATTALVRLAADGLAVDQPLAWPKGSTWLLHGANGRLTLARYLPPLPLTPAFGTALGTARGGAHDAHPGA